MGRDLLDQQRLGPNCLRRILEDYRTEQRAVVPQPRARSNGEIEDHRSALLAVEPESYEDDSSQERFYVGLAESLKTLS